MLVLTKGTIFTILEETVKLMTIIITTCMNSTLLLISGKKYSLGVVIMEMILHQPPEMTTVSRE